MALVEVQPYLNVEPYLNFMPFVRQTPQRMVWFYYDQTADVLYINFKKPSVATDSELTDNDIVIRYEGEEVIGLTILHVGQRSPSNKWLEVKGFPRVCGS